MNSQLNNRFSFARLKQILSAQLSVERQELILKTGVFLIVINALYMYHFSMAQPSDDKIVLFWIFTQTLISFTKVAWLVDAASLFFDYHQKVKANKTFLLPVSQGEQFAARALQSIATFFVLYSLLATTVMTWIGATGNYDAYVAQFEQLELIGFNTRTLIFELISAFAIWGLAIAIALLFRRRQRLICLIAIALLYTPSFVMPFVVGLSDNPKVYIDYAVWHTVLKIVFLLVAFFSFFRFKRLQIIH